MPRKRTDLKDNQEKSEKEESPIKKKNSASVVMATGRRKSAIASVWLSKGKGPILVNEQPLEEYFKSPTKRKLLEEPFRVVNRLGQFSATVKVRGGGVSSQVAAVVHAFSRALASYDEAFRAILRKKKLLTRDSRVKERRKYGHAGKARKMKQSPKR